MLTIKNPEVDALITKLQAQTGQTKTSLVKQGLEALHEQLASIPNYKSKKERLNDIVKAYCDLPDLDTRSPEEIIGYNEYGVPE